MRHKVFFRKRFLWVPTFWTIIITFSVLIGSSFFMVKNLAYFLAKQEPVNSDVLVVEGWLPEESIKQAFLEFKNGDYKLIITTGGPDLGYNAQYATYAERAGAALINLGLRPSQLLVIPSPASAQERTFLSAVMVRVALAKLNSAYKAVNVFSGDVHARRTHLLYGVAFRETDINIGILVANSNQFELAYWWKNSNGAKSVLTEFIGWLWVKCCFNPVKTGTHNEVWGTQL